MESETSKQRWRRGKIFICYRRDGGADLARLVHDSLQQRGYEVFMDVESLRSGPFNTALFNEIESATDVVVILTPGSLDRCHNEGDWVRLEIAHAIKQKRNVVPLMARGFAWPTPAEPLPDDLAALPTYNGVSPSHEYFSASLDKLTKLLTGLPRRSRSWFYGIAAALVIAVVGTLAVTFVPPLRQVALPGNPTGTQTSLTVPAPRPVETAPPVKSNESTPTPPVGTPVTVRAPVANMEGAAITITCSEDVRIKPLEVGQPATFHPKKEPGLIKHISPELSGWQFVGIPWDKIISYEIRVNQDGILYAFSCNSKIRKTAQDFLGVEEASKWEDAANAIRGQNFNICFQRKVAAGEIIKLKGHQCQLAAKSIELVRDGKAESAMPMVVPAAPPAVVAPPPQVPPEVQDLFTPAFAALPADVQLNRVASKLQELNHGFNGDVRSKKHQSGIEIILDNTPIKNLWPLRALVNLRSLRCGACAVTDLSPLRGMPLEAVFCQLNPLSDLSPLQGMQLNTLFVNGTKVRDLSPLRGMPLRTLSCKSSSVTDFSPLKTMPNLRGFVCDFVPVRDSAILRSIKTLESINHMPVKEFWKSVDAGKPPQAVKDEDE